MRNCWLNNVSIKSGEDSSKKRRFGAGLALVAVAMLAAADEGKTPLVYTPAAIPWPADAQPGAVQMAVITGDPMRAGSYTVRYRLPAGLKLMPHWHPDTREVVVLSGTFHYGYGETFEPAKLHTLPPGSFFTEPAGLPHFAWTRSGEVILQATGVGPTATTYLVPRQSNMNPAGK
jgi:uncharacterized RmlC-like cupin family protein